MKRCTRRSFDEAVSSVPINRQDQRVRSSAQVKDAPMMARVQLDASHVSRCVTARREKVPRYIRVSNELLRYAHSDCLFTLASLEHTERELVTVP